MVRGQNKGGSEIARLADKARDKAKFESRARKNANAVNRVAVEASAKIKFSAKFQGAKIEKAEAEARKNVEAEVK